ncbi:sugar ABC transporter permease [bacterium]|nr:sugar ABC transporter permease [bacterium]MCB2179115.1 sugar ABC transporter permease [bacterium]
MNISDRIQLVFTPRRLRYLREYLTGYLFIAPAVSLIFLFGIFPVGFALYVSLHKWRIKQSDYLGLVNYTKAVGNLAYVLLFFLALGALVAVYFLLRKIISTAKENQEAPWLMVLPGLLHASVIGAFLRYIWFQLPEFLSIGDKLKGKEKTRELFNQLLKDSFVAVRPQFMLFFGLLVASIVIGATIAFYRKSPRNLSYQSQFMMMWASLFAGVGLIYFTYSEVLKAYAEAVATETDPGIWPQVITISGGVFLLVIAWQLWNGASKENSNRRFWLRIFGALTLLVGGWLLIGEIPQIVAAGDPDLWSGLKVTVFFALGTVPFQLGFSMFLAILLFQKLKGSEIFRMIFFLPYVTPFIASATIFKQMFSNRESAPINFLLETVGLTPQKWLFESKGIFAIIASGQGWDWPAWAAGPSLALIVIIIHSIWTYVGYDTVIYLAGLVNIPKELNEAAEIDGASKWDIFRNITFPLLSPTTYFLSLIAIIGTFKAFATIWVFRESLAQGTVDTFSVAIFTEFFEKLRYGYASAMAFVLFAIILSLTYINNKVQGSKVFYG